MRSLFYSYQWNWLTDPSPFKIGLWARQTGKDYTCAAEAVMDCAVTPHNHWLIIACGERQAIESLQHAKSWAERLCHSQIKYHKSEILFRNGSRITALPAKPETIRGYSANLILIWFFLKHLVLLEISKVSTVNILWISSICSPDRLNLQTRSAFNRHLMGGFLVRVTPRHTFLRLMRPSTRLKAVTVSG